MQYVFLLLLNLQRKRQQRPNQFLTNKLQAVTKSANITSNIKDSTLLTFESFAHLIIFPLSPACEDS